MSTLIIALLSIFISVIAQFSLKAGMSSAEVKDIMAQPHAIRTVFVVLSNRFVLTGFVFYGVGAVVWLGVLSKWDVSKAYPLVGIGFAFALVIGLVNGEHVTLSRVVGVALICAGVFLVSRS